MEYVITLVLFYLAVGAALFAHSAYPGIPNDFDWRSQIRVFRVTFLDVLGWPLALFRLCAARD